MAKWIDLYYKHTSHYTMEGDYHFDSKTLQHELKKIKTIHMLHINCYEHQCGFNFPKGKICVRDFPMDITIVWKGQPKALNLPTMEACECMREDLDKCGGFCMYFDNKSVAIVCNTGYREISKNFMSSIQDITYDPKEGLWLSV